MRLRMEQVNPIGPDRNQELKKESHKNTRKISLLAHIRAISFNSLIKK